MKVYVVGLGELGHQGIVPLAVFQKKETARTYILQFLAPQISHMVEADAVGTERWEYNTGFIESRECECV